jgi:hypothetical protein
MSGPILRKYGFPNFEKIFGEHPMEHGVDEAENPDSTKKRADEAMAGESAAQTDPRKNRKQE